MPSKKTTKAAAPKSLSSSDLQDVLKRVKATTLSAEDKAAVGDILTQTIKLKKLVEKSTVSHGEKRVIARLPLGFDIVK